MMIRRFIEESNSIEGIRRTATIEEIDAFQRFQTLEKLTVDELIAFVNVYQPGARLRLADEFVMVGEHTPPTGGMNILYELDYILRRVNSGNMTPYQAHVAYETLHPFTDCNGRSGRAIWYWMMTRDGGTIELDFLHEFYYQALRASRL